MNRLGLNLRFISKEMGFILALESFFLFLSAFIAFMYDSWETKYLVISGGITLLGGVALTLIGHKATGKNIGRREGVVTVTSAWFLFCIFGMLPYYISGAIPSLTDAFFETMSGLTTTGSTILPDVEVLPKGLLFWRCFTQWIGGLGMIVFVLAFLPLLGGGGAAHLFDAETTGITHDKFRPRVGQVAKRLWGIYTGLTLILMFLLWLGPMDFFDSICHALATLSTGGYSTKQASIAYWDSSYVDCIVIIFMLIGSINFSLFYFCLKGNFKRLIKDEELHWYLSIIGFATVLVSIVLLVTGQMHHVGETFRNALFQVVSVISTTGFATADYVAWGPFFWVTFTLLMLVCGCGGSTSGGMKTVRIMVLAKNTINEFNKQIHPRAVLPVRINGAAISVDVVHRILAFAFLYMLLILVSLLFFTLTGMGFEESWGATLSGISNAGPGLGTLGPNGSFAEMPVIAKWYYSFLMITGRLEIFTVLILFTPGFWKR